jgi:hypothetical protein
VSPIWRIGQELARIQVSLRINHRVDVSMITVLMRHREPLQPLAGLSLEPAGLAVALSSGVRAHGTVLCRIGAADTTGHVPKSGYA